MVFMTKGPPATTGAPIGVPWPNGVLSREFPLKGTGCALRAQARLRGKSGNGYRQ